MYSRLPIWILPLCLIGASAAAQEVDFNRDVRPILSNNCLLCHGPDESSVEAGLRLDRRETATAELESGTTAIVPGQPEDSEMVARITADDDDLRMPPADSGSRLTAEEIQILTAWIEQGAAYAKHWSYETPVRPTLPEVSPSHQNWTRNEIDAFVLRRMREHGLTPSEPADRYALARRVSLDLTGLPPTPEAADAFASSTDPLAYEKLVDELLASPAYGEHWARQWLDLARYADSAGYADDPPRTIWAYRDWVIRAFNSGMPFDQFTIEQLAGDLLPDPSQDQLIATAFHRNTMTNNEGGTQDEEFRNVAVVDRVNTTMAVWMGTTMACAQCHTHKYDPITQEEYFRFFAVFNNTEDADKRNEAPVIQVLTEEQKTRKEELKKKLAALQTVFDTPSASLTASQRDWEHRVQAESEWLSCTPAKITRQSGLPSTIGSDGRIDVEAVSDTDAYVVEFPLKAVPSSDAGELQNQSGVTAIQLTTLPRETLPGLGAGHGGGNFVITGIQADLIPSKFQIPTARFVRITNNGSKQILSLAEVEVFSAGSNIASQGTASQHSTAYNGPARLAIDGVTDGDYSHESVTHTETVDDPWWELDLAAPTGIDRVSIWNRTDNNLQKRLSDFTVQLLDGDRNVVWEKRLSESPDPSVTVSPDNVRKIALQSAFADYHQPGFEATEVLAGTTGQNDGWAVGGAITSPHHLTIIPATPVPADGSTTLRLRIEQLSPHKNHILGSFRLAVSRDLLATERARIPEGMMALVRIPSSERTEQQATKLASFYRDEVAPELAKERKTRERLEQQLAQLKPATSVPVLRERPGTPRETHLQHRGNYLDPGPKVSPGVPEVFPAIPDSLEPSRLDVARWLVDESNPLTARVLANRLWETLFGRGLVVTSEEFGSQGEPPSHPQLLDWLATELHRNGWDMKDLLRQIVTSATYRQSSKVTPESAAADFGNRWLSRGPRVRLTAEMVRDQALFAAGLLSDRMFGPPVKPPQPNLGLTAAFGSSTDWKTSEGLDRYRRGIYTTWRRSNPYPSMATFDAPNREVCTIRRNSTNTPLQSLVTLNDPVYVEAAQSLARQALQSSESLDDQLTAAFRSCLIRPPTESELEALRDLYHDTRSRFAGKDDDAMALATEPLGSLPEGLGVEASAAMTVVANVLLNLDEMFLKR